MNQPFQYVTVVRRDDRVVLGAYHMHDVPRDGDHLVIGEQWYRVVQVIWNLNSANGREVTLRVI